MKNFLCKLFTYVVIISLITLGINLLYIREVKDNDTITDVPDNIRICNFGSSHGLYGFDYQDVEGKYTCFNFALSSQSLLYDYRILLNYKGKIQNGATVFITVSYFSFFGEPEYKDENFASKNKRYYKFLPSELITEYNWKTDMYVNYLPALSSEGLFKLVKVLLHLNEATDEGINIAKVDDDAMAAYKRHIANKFDTNGNRIRKQEAFEAIYGMINLCREIGARPIMITPPYFHVYTEVVRKEDPNFFGDFYAVLDEIVSNTGCEYYDYAFDDRFCRDFSLFRDSDHLSRKGARTFTDNILSEILSIDIQN